MTTSNGVAKVTSNEIVTESQGEETCVNCVFATRFNRICITCVLRNQQFAAWHSCESWKLESNMEKSNDNI